MLKMNDLIEVSKANNGNVELTDELALSIKEYVVGNKNLIEITVMECGLPIYKETLYFTNKSKLKTGIKRIDLALKNVKKELNEENTPKLSVAQADAIITRLKVSNVLLKLNKIKHLQLNKVKSDKDNKKAA